MSERTCAACDCKLDADAINVKIGGKIVEVCCEDCAVALKEADASVAGSEDHAASRLASVILGALLVLTPISGALAGAGGEIRIADTDPDRPLTLTGAKQLVARWLNDSGEGQLRVGRAEFDRDGNVAVEVVGAGGIAVRHVLVDGKTGMVAAAQLAKKSRQAVE